MTEIRVMTPEEMRSAIPTEVSPRRIVILEDVRRYVDELDFSSLKQRLCTGEELLGRNWSAGRADHAERLYKRWLYLRRRFEGDVLPPHVDIDEFWHGHILETQRYFHDCDRVFGYYFHHFPGFGARGVADRQNLLTAWQQTQQFYWDEYGEWIYDYSE